MNRLLHCQDKNLHILVGRLADRYARRIAVMMKMTAICIQNDAHKFENDSSETILFDTEIRHSILTKVVLYSGFLWTMYDFLVNKKRIVIKLTAGKRGWWVRGE